MPYLVRNAVEEDLSKIAELLDTYMCRYLGANWKGNLHQLRDHFVHRSVRLVVAESDLSTIGFAAWLPDYDLHHCVHGARVIDFYVVPAFRGLAVGPSILARVAANVRDEGALYLRGEALEDSKLRQFYARFAVDLGNVFNLSGKAFLQLAALDGKSPKELVKGLPTKAMNYEN